MKATLRRAQAPQDPSRDRVRARRRVSWAALRPRRVSFKEGVLAGDAVPSLATVELSRAEVMSLLSLVRARLGEVEQMMRNLEEGEGMDLPRHNALRTMRPQAEALEDLVLKLEGALRELGG